MMIKILLIKLLLKSEGRPEHIRTALEWYGDTILEVMLLDNSEPMNYEEAMMSPDSNKMA